MVTWINDEKASVIFIVLLSGFVCFGRINIKLACLRLHVMMTAFWTIVVSQTHGINEYKRLTIPNTQFTI